MDIARISIGYELRDKLTQVMVDEIKNALFIHPIFGAQPEKEFKPVEGTELFSLDYWQCEMIVDFDKINTIPCEVKCRLRIGDALIRATEPRPPAFNDKVNVSVPSNALLNIHTVKVLENACTEVLQEEINSGWTILAICPQPDQRRPDYILGRK
ncbi:hypothetical protein UFOVP580_43 [uncultured Caudovirales phage]|uniref:Uncharacterized protein n=1 Tax=uncultured Caudovirales phage TaxID=2100421 RepID=A0A6J5PA66_9CAUD|nr:hypothetical protein UFOVP580_43 [uncultured Caudovirales phage]